MCCAGAHYMAPESTDRHVNLVRTTKMHIDQDGVFAYSNLTWVGSKASAVLHLKADVVNHGNAQADACVAFTLTAPDGSSVGVDATTKMSIAPGASGTGTADMSVPHPMLWTSSNPWLYNISAEVTNCKDEASLDTVDIPHGFRSLRYDANDGFFLNKVSGHHSAFTGTLV
jgi:beta-galactosidase